MFSVPQFIVRSLIYHWRTNAAVGLGVAAATAVLVGALIVGDSIRGSLQKLTLERLGRVDFVLATDHFFRAQLVDELDEEPSFRAKFSKTVPAILLPSVTVETTSGDQRRAGEVFVIGCNEDFWKFDITGLKPKLLQPNEIILNDTLAKDLNVKAGDEVTIRLADASQIPADSTLGQKSNRIRSLPRLRVTDVVPARGLGNFRLQPSQGLSRNAFVAIESIQDALDEDGRVNAILVSGQKLGTVQTRHRGALKRLESLFRPRLSDYGLKLTPVRRDFTAPGGSTQTIWNYHTLTTDRMVLQSEVARASMTALEKYNAQEVFTYLADSIRLASSDGRDSVEIPYSTITGIESSAEFPLLPEGQQLGDNEIVLNRWAAERLKVQPGEKILVEYFEPETVHGEHKLSRHEFTLRSVVPITEPASAPRRNRPVQFDEPPTLFNDPDLTPMVKGITDQESIEDWEAPFPFDIKRMKTVDDLYWKNHRTTPKAFVNLKTAQRLWGSRFGHVTSIRIPAAQLTSEQIEESLVNVLRNPKVHGALGLAFQPVKQQGLQASSGSTPFDALFLGLSFFIILSALLLVALTFRLSVERRSSELGILAASGLPRGRVVRWLIAEGAVIAAIGGVIGVLIGLAYARLMIAGLQSESWWLGAISSPFLSFFASPRSLIIGYASGVIISVIAIYLAARRLNRVAPRTLLAGQIADSLIAPRRAGWITLVLGIVLLVAAIGTASFALRLSGEAQAGAFVGSGALVLAALLLLIWNRLRSASVIGHAFDLVRLAITTGARNPMRSTLTLGLMGSAAFLIVAMSAFRVSPTLEGTGGFQLIARTSTPVYQNLNDPKVRADVIGDEASQLSGVEIFSFRWKAGDDASCRNLYQVSRPQVLGISDAFISHFDDPEKTHFSWAADAGQKNPWHLLRGNKQGNAIPVILDNNTAMYSLHWSGGVGSVHEVTYESGKTLRFRIVGLLSNSVLQGMLLIDERSFRGAFPEVSGYRYFLIGGPKSKTQTAQSLLEKSLRSEGFDAVNAADVLTGLLAVQNTYLSTFQSLGALGLLLGTFGLATVQARSVLERRGELAVLRAQGFRKGRVIWLVLLENLALLLGGLAVGIIAALCAVLPHILFAGRVVPISGVLILLAVVLVVGAISGAAAVRMTLRGTLIEALRGE